MSKKLFIGRLSWDTTSEGLKAAFEAAGVVVSAQVITDRMSGRSKGFGFVEMATEEEAQNAISMFDGKELDGRTIAVSEARPMEERPRREFRPRTNNRSFGGGNDYAA